MYHEDSPVSRPYRRPEMEVKMPIAKSRTVGGSTEGINVFLGMRLLNLLDEVDGSLIVGILIDDDDIVMMIVKKSDSFPEKLSPFLLFMSRDQIWR